MLRAGVLNMQPGSSKQPINYFSVAHGWTIFVTNNFVKLDKFSHLLNNDYILKKCRTYFNISVSFTGRSKTLKLKESNFIYIKNLKNVNEIYLFQRSVVVEGVIEILLYLKTDWDNRKFTHPTEHEDFSFLFEMVDLTTHTGIGKVYLRWQITHTNRKSRKMFGSALLNEKEIISVISVINFWIWLWFSLF